MQQNVFTPWNPYSLPATKWNLKKKKSIQVKNQNNTNLSHKNYCHIKTDATAKRS